jgi:hypothetical protein
MAITSATHIVNNALIRLGAKNITDLDTDGTQTSATMVQLYEHTRDSLLRQHFWNFAIKRVSLAADAVTPAFEYANQYTLPADFIRVKKIYNSDLPYTIEGGSLLIDQSTELQLIYVSRVTDVTQFDTLFTQVLILMLAILAAARIVGDGYKTGPLLQELNQLLLEAKIVDAQDGTPETLIVSAFQEARLGLTSDRFNVTRVL